MIFKKHAHHHGVSKRVRILAWLSVVGWALLIVALIVFHYGRPEHQYGVMTYFGYEARNTWLADLHLLYVLLLFSCAGLSLLSLFINRSRVKHPHRVRYNVVLLLLISISMLILSL